MCLFQSSREPQCSNFSTQFIVQRTPKKCAPAKLLASLQLAPPSTKQHDKPLVRRPPRLPTSVLKTYHLPTQTPTPTPPASASPTLQSPFTRVASIHPSIHPSMQPSHALHPMSATIPNNVPPHKQTTIKEEHKRRRPPLPRRFTRRRQRRRSSFVRRCGVHSNEVGDDGGLVWFGHPLTHSPTQLTIDTLSLQSNASASQKVNFLSSSNFLCRSIYLNLLRLCILPSLSPAHLSSPLFERGQVHACVAR